MRSVLISVLCLYTGAVYGASIWDCVKTLPTEPVAKSVPTPTAQVQAGTDDSFWSVVMPVAPPTPVVPIDEEIVKAISTEISQKAGEGIDIRVECENGVVTITGTVENETQSQKIAWIAQSTSGVKSVVNNIIVKEEEKVEGGQEVRPTTNTQYAPKRVFRFRSWRSSGCANGTCNR